MSIEPDDLSAASARRRLLSLTALVAVVLIAIVTIAVYGMYRLDRTLAANEAEIDRMTEIADGARVGQTAFKTQVQEWKNILLRGYDAKDYATYHDAFLARRDDVEKQLQALAAQAQAIGFPGNSLAALQSGHEELDKAYDQALAQLQPVDPMSVRAVDASVRGRDRPLNDAFDAFAEEVKAFADERRAGLRTEIVAEAASMRSTLYVSLAIGLIVLLIGAFISMRAIRPVT